MNEERTNDTEMKKVHRLGANEERAGTCFAKKENEEEEEEGATEDEDDDLLN